MALGPIGTPAVFTSATGTVAVNHTLVARANGYVKLTAFCADTGGTPTLNTLTYGGVAATVKHNAAVTFSGLNSRIVIAVVPEASLPANGVNSASVAFSAGVFSSIAVDTWEDADQSATGDTDSATGSSATAAVPALTTNVGDAATAFAIILSTAAAAAAGGATERINSLDGGASHRRISSYLIADGASETLSYTNGNAAWVAGGLVFSPAAAAPVTLTPGTASLVIAGGTATVVATANVALSCTPASLVVTGATSTVVATAHVALTASPASLVVAGGTSTVTTTAHVSLTPAPAALVIAGGASTVATTAHVALSPSPAALTVTGRTSSVAATAHVSLTPAPASLAISGGMSTVVAGGNVSLSPAPASLVLAGGTSTPGARWFSPFPAILPFTAWYVCIDAEFHRLRRERIETGPITFREFHRCYSIR